MSALKILILSLLLSTSAIAEDWNKILGMPPSLGSAEELLDLQTLMELQETRSEGECADAKREGSLTLKSLFGGEDGVLSAREVSKNKILFYRFFVKAGLKTKNAKKHFARLRPFARFKQIIPCIDKPDPNESYPSGHTSIARIMAYALSKKYPERKLQFFKRADDVANNRLIGGVHFPTDVVSGKRLADYLATKYFK